MPDEPSGRREGPRRSGPAGPRPQKHAPESDCVPAAPSGPRPGWPPCRGRVSLRRGIRRPVPADATPMWAAVPAAGMTRAPLWLQSVPSSGVQPPPLPPRPHTYALMHTASFPPPLAPNASGGNPARGRRKEGGRKEGGRKEAGMEGLRRRVGRRGGRKEGGTEGGGDGKRGGDGRRGERKEGGTEGGEGGRKEGGGGRRGGTEGGGRMDRRKRGESDNPMAKVVIKLGQAFMVARVSMWQKKGADGRRGGNPMAVAGWSEALDRRGCVCGAARRRARRPDSPAGLAESPRVCFD